MNFHLAHSRTTRSKRRSWAGRRYRKVKLAVEQLEDRTLLSPGDLDLAFDGDGRLTTDFGGSEHARGVALQADGKIVVVGSTSPRAGQGGFAIVRYNRDGSLDDGGPSDSTPGDRFGTNGKVTTDLESSSASAKNVAIQPGGKIVVVGAVSIGGNADFVVARFNPDGSLDDGTASDSTPGDQFGTGGGDPFGTPGKVSLDFGFIFDGAEAVAIQSDGKIVVGGMATIDNSFHFRFALARFNADGSVDDGGPADSTVGDNFGTSGKVLTGFGGNLASIADIALQPDGKIVAAGFTTAAGSDTTGLFALARYDTNGNLDASFDGDGLVTVDFGGGDNAASAVVVQPDGKIVATGSAIVFARGQDFALVRFNSNGSLDDDGPADSTPGDSFGFGGKVLADFATSDDFPRDAVLQPDGKFVLAGSSLVGSEPVIHHDFALARFNSDGSPDDGSVSDTTPADQFGTGGKATTDFGSAAPTQDDAEAIALDADGRLVVVGTSETDFAVARYLADAGTPPPPPVPPDTDRDGIPDPIEAAAPNGGDGNHDGLPDSEQDSVASLPNAIDGRYVTIETASGKPLLNVRGRNLAPPINVMLPLGAFAFTVGNLMPGDSETVTLFLPSSLTIDSGYKFGATANDTLVHWYDFPFDVASGTGVEQLDDNGDGFTDRMLIHLIDGGRGDDDLAADGKIVDPIAPAVVRVGSGAGSISGTKFHDVDDDGVNDGPFFGERPLPGWTIFLDLNGNGLFEPDAPHNEPFAVTDEFGQYAFTGLARDTYAVAEVPQPGWINTTPARFEQNVVPVGGNPRSVATGDLNGDRYDDLVVVVNDLADYDVGVFINNRDGTFTLRNELSASGSPEAVTIANLNGDAFPDLAVTSTLGNRVVVFLGTATGSFDRTATDFAVGQEPFGIVAADLDLDGNIDLVTANFDSDTLSLLKGQGDGTFAAAMPIAAGDGPEALVLGQFNSGTGPGTDAFLDLAVANRNSEDVSIFLGDGQGGFSLLQTIPLNGGPTRVGAITVGQFNPGQDALVDLAVAMPDADAIAVLFGTGLGQFQLQSPTPAGDRPTAVTTIRLDDDLVVDLVVANADGSSLTLLTGNGDGTFTSLGDVPLADRPFQLAVADLDHDGHSDLAAASPPDGSITALFANPGLAHRVRLGNSPRALFVDFGNRSLFNGEIHGTVWFDQNGDGQRNNGPEGFPEPGLNRWFVYLDINHDGQFDPQLEPSTSTNAAGEFDFFNLPPDGYDVRQVVQAGFEQTFPAEEFQSVRLGENTVIRGILFGNHLSPGTIRGFVWDDQNGNGVRDNADGDPFFDEPGQSGITVYLDMNANGQFDPDQGEPSRVTGPAGDYEFADVSAGRSYLVAEIVPPSFVATFPAARSPQGLRVDLGPNETAIVNFGNAAVAEIRGTKWTDLNRNGAPDPDEPRGAGVIVFVDVNQNGTLDPSEPSAITAIDGSYTIENVPPGSYTVTDNVVRSFGAPDTRVSRSFGFSLASVDGFVAVGDPQALREDPGPDAVFESGRVYLFDATTGVLVRELDSRRHAVENAFFGFSMARASVDGGGSLLAVGIPVRMLFGEVLVFDPSTGRTVDLAGPPIGIFDTGAFYGNFGISVAGFDNDVFLGPDAFAVGAPGVSSEAGPGFVGKFVPFTPRPNGKPLQWVHVVDQTVPSPYDLIFGMVSSFNPADPVSQEMNDFGESVAGLDHRILAGDPSSDAGALDAGEVRLLDAADGSLLLTIHNPAPGVRDNFGAAVAAFGDDLLVGAPSDDLGASDSGAVYLFDGENGSLLQTFADPTPASFDRFGFAVTAVGNYVLVGAPHDDTRGPNAGAVYVFEGATGQFVRAIFSPFPQAGAEFGFALAAAGENQILIGSPSVEEIAEPGAAFLFDLGRQVSLAPGQILEQVDFVAAPAVEVATPAIRGTVYDDRDADGQFDSDERGVSSFGFLVFLDLNEDGVANPGEPFRQPDALGEYEFLRLRPGTYRVVLQIPPGWTPTALSGASVFAELGPGDDLDDVNFGIRQDDNDSDGVADTVEGFAPNSGDGNIDGILDREQLNVSSLPNSLDGRYVTLVTPAGTQLVDVQAIPNPSPSDAPAAAGFPAGFLDFTVEGVSPGGSITVDLILQSAPAISTYYKYGPTPGNLSPHWYEFLFNRNACTQGIDCTGAEIHGNVITLHFVDGQRGDDDLTANGRIVEPGGPALVSLGSISGQTIHDLDGDGQHDEFEPGLEGWTVQLLDDQGDLVASTQTQPAEFRAFVVPREIVRCFRHGRRRQCVTVTIYENMVQIVTEPGFYHFTDLPPGIYTLVELPQPGWGRSFPASAGSHSVTLGSGQVVEGLDFGNVNLGGNVTAQVVRGRLVVCGDDAPNHIRIEQAEMFGDIEQAGAKIYRIIGTNGTQVNGRFDPAEFSGVRGGIRIKTGLGDDVVLVSALAESVSPITIRNGLTIATGPGNDTVRLDHVTVRGRAAIHAGPGNDLVETLDSLFTDDLFLDTGAGHDTLRMTRTIARQFAVVRTDPVDLVEITDSVLDSLAHRAIWRRGTLASLLRFGNRRA